jgi:hypothetical protein
LIIQLTVIIEEKQSITGNVVELLDQKANEIQESTKAVVLRRSLSLRHWLGSKCNLHTTLIKGSPQTFR